MTALLDMRDIAQSCRDCRADFTVTVAEQQFLKHLEELGKLGEWKAPTRCPWCRRAARKHQYAVTSVGPDIERGCVDCDAVFTFSNRDQGFYHGRGYQMPRRCPGCRRKRRAPVVGGVGIGVAS